MNCKGYLDSTVYSLQIGEDKVINYLRQTKKSKETRNIADPTSVIETKADSAMSHFEEPELNNQRSLNAKMSREYTNQRKY